MTYACWEITASTAQNLSEYTYPLATFDERTEDNNNKIILKSTHFLSFFSHTIVQNHWKHELKFIRILCSFVRTIELSLNMFSFVYTHSCARTQSNHSLRLLFDSIDSERIFPYEFFFVFSFVLVSAWLWENFSFNFVFIYKLQFTLHRHEKSNMRETKEWKNKNSHTFRGHRCRSAGVAKYFLLSSTMVFHWNFQFTKIYFVNSSLKVLLQEL